MQLTCAIDTSFTRLTGGATIATVGVVGLGVDAFVGAVGETRLARQFT